MKAFRVSCVAAHHDHAATESRKSEPTISLCIYIYTYIFQILQAAAAETGKAGMCPPCLKIHRIYCDRDGTLNSKEDAVCKPSTAATSSSAHEPCFQD